MGGERTRSAKNRHHVGELGQGNLEGGKAILLTTEEVTKTKKRGETSGKGVDGLHDILSTRAGSLASRHVIYKTGT